MNDTELIRTGTAARILGTSRQHVVDLCERGVLSCVRNAGHRRLRRSEVEALAVATDPPRLNPQERQSRWLHAAVAARLVSDPARTLERAQHNLRRLRAAHPSGMSRRWLDRWQAIIDAGPDAVLDTLTSDSPVAVELRQNSPFAGVLSDSERMSILTAFREVRGARSL
jgi:excisionase family DNA binding protein